MKETEIKNCAENLLAMKGNEISKQEVRVAVWLNFRTKQLYPIEQNQIINRVWEKIKQ